ncbi:MAG: acyclic terpene utilization AtuA family protein [Thermoleophilaceae bacterium]
MKTLSYVVDGRLGDRLPQTVDSVVRTIREGVDVVAGQGTGMDAGPYYLGTDGVMPLRRGSVEPVLLAAKETGTPFVFSMGGAAGADVHLEAYLDVVREIARDNGTTFRVAVISGEISEDWLKQKLRDGTQARRSIETPRLSEYLTEQDVAEAVRIQSQMGPEPIMRALAEDGIDGVITGRALDLGVMMAPLLAHGYPRGLAGHAAKVIECGGMCAEPSQGWEGVLAELDGDSFTVTPVNPDFRCTVRSITGHSLYEREDPFEERNPGGVLDVGHAVYEQVDDRTVRCSGGKWRDAPYTIKLEGAKQLGFQAATLCAIRDEVLIRHLDGVLDDIREAVEHVSNGIDYTLTFRVLGRDAVLGSAEPNLGKVTPYEVGVLTLVTAPTQEQAMELTTTARLRLFLADYPDRRTTAGNAAVPLQQTQFTLGPAYAFNVWHLLPLEDPCEPFTHEIVELG